MIDNLLAFEKIVIETIIKDNSVYISYGDKILPAMFSNKHYKRIVEHFSYHNELQITLNGLRCSSMDVNGLEDRRHSDHEFYDALKGLMQLYTVKLMDKAINDVFTTKAIDGEAVARAKFLSDMAHINKLSDMNFTEGGASRDDLLDGVKSYMERRTLMDKSNVIPIGYKLLDERLNGGFQRGNLVSLLGNTGAGKSVFAVNMYLKMLAAGSKGFYITTEMTTREVEDRIHDIHIGKVVTAKTGFTHLDLETAMISAAGISKHHWLYHSSALTYSKIKRAINKYRDYNNGVDFVIIDSLNRMSYGKYDDEWRMVEEVTQALKNLAMDMNMVVIQLVQPGEANLKEKNKRITLATMGGSRKVRQESNYIFTLYRGAYIDNQLGESVCGKFDNLTELIIPKAREFKPKGVVFESAGIKLEEAMAGTVADYRKYLME